MLNFFRQLFKPKYETLNLVEIKAANLIANYNYLKSCQPTAEIFPVLKANAYGHGLKEVCQILNATDALMVAVDSYPEAQIVYRYFRKNVLILGEMPLKAYTYCRWKRTEVVVYNENTLRYLARFGQRVRVHLFVNSGMNREGIKDLDAFIARNKKYLEKVSVAGLCSHLASADEDSDLNRRQEENFLASLNSLRAAGFFPRWVHLGNSAGVFTLNNKLLTAYRPGLAFYGYHPLPEKNRNSVLRPALQVFSHVVSLQPLEPGESVSYNETYHVKNSTTIAIIPFGYFEGLERRWSGRAKFLVSGSAGNFWAPIVGRICMNLACLDIGRQAIQIGARVQIIAADPEADNSLLNLAKLSEAIPYEILVKLQANIRRKVV
jgi:alanine racemase